MDFFLDENFPKNTAPLLEGLGHKVYDIRGSNFEGSTDQRIFQLAQREKAVFLTTDKDFFHTIPRLYNKHHGIVVIALARPDAESITNKMKWALGFMAKHELANSCLLLKDRRHYFSKIK